MTSLSRVAVAVAGGVAWAVCFGERPALVVGWMALVPLVLLLGGRRAALLGWLHGAVFWLVSIRWIVPTLETYGGLERPLATAAFALLCLYLGSYHAVFAGLGSFVWRRSKAWALLGLPALWVVLELVATHLFTGFPWNLAAYAAIETPGALSLAAWGGPLGVSFLVVAANVALACLVVGRSRRAAIGLLAGVAVLLALGRVGKAQALVATRAEAAVIRLVQPNAPIVLDASDGRSLDGYRRLLVLTAQACAPGTLVVWPESAAWPYVLARDARLRGDLERLTASGCSILFNTVSIDDEGYYNSAVLFDPVRALQRYDKTHLVPFGEYVPLAERLPFLRRLARGAGDFAPGSEMRAFEWEGLRLGVAICFEIIFSGEIADRVRDGATVIVTITNDAWYGDSAAPWQHLRAARFRAAETRRPVVRAALTGVSAVIAADGSVAAWLGLGESGVLEAAPGASNGLTPYTRAPWVVPLAAVIVLGFAILRCGRAGRNGRPPPERGTPI